MKLHLGCGKRYISGFVHVDAIRYEHVDYIMNVDNLSLFQDESVDLIYTCHVLEHFHRAKTRKVLAEWCRVLKVGGVLRLSVPDFEAACELYMEKKELSLVIGLIMGRQNYLYNVHYNMFDFATLKEDLEATGFGKVTRYDWRTTGHADVDDYSQAYYPHLERETGRLMSLNVEATKIDVSAMRG